MKKMLSLLFAVGDVLVGSGQQQNQTVTLTVGDPAPALQVSRWVQGEPVNSFERGKVYLVEFWATWCPPCRASVPHMNEIQNKYKDQGLIVIGQNIAERDKEASKVPGFIKSMGTNMTYRVALDKVDSDPAKGRMAETWMKPAGLNFIPSAFLIDKEGKIAWIGNPFELENTVIEQVLAGTYEPAESK